MKILRAAVFRLLSIIAWLQERLAALKAQSGEAPAKATAPGGPSYFKWRENTYIVFGERLKGSLQTAGELLSEAERSKTASDGGAADLSQLEKLVAAFNDAKSIARHSLATNSGTLRP